MSSSSESVGALPDPTPTHAITPIPPFEPACSRHALLSFRSPNAMNARDSLDRRMRVRLPPPSYGNREPGVPQ
eukprot:5323823-Alexandrium_andersonii.AAC.1